MLTEVVLLSNFCNLTFSRVTQGLLLRLQLEQFTHSIDRIFARDSPAQIRVVIGIDRLFKALGDIFVANFVDLRQNYLRVFQLRSLVYDN